MSKFRTNITNFSSALKEARLNKVAAAVDDINKKTGILKNAQYEGVQGYWIQNGRCWQNCYRQKRAESDKPAQEVWFECYKEYVEAINKSPESWNKYADDKSVGNIKIADELLVKNIKTASNKSEIPHIVFDTIEKELNKNSLDLLKQAERLSNISAFLYEKNKPALSKIAKNLSLELVKEAQFGGKSWFNPKNWAGNARSQFGYSTSEDITARLNGILLEIQNLRTRFPQNMTNIPNREMQENLNVAFENMQNKVEKELSLLEKATRKDPKAGTLYQKIIPAFSQFAKAKNLSSRRIALDTLGNAVSKALGQTSQMYTIRQKDNQMPGLQGKPQQPQTQQQPQQPKLNELSSNIRNNIDQINNILRQRGANFLLRSAKTDKKFKVAQQQLNLEQIADYLINMQQTSPNIFNAILSTGKMSTTQPVQEESGPYELNETEEDPQNTQTQLQPQSETPDDNFNDFESDEEFESMMDYDDEAVSETTEEQSTESVGTNLSEWANKLRGMLGNRVRLNSGENRQLIEDVANYLDNQAMSSN